MPIPTLSSTTPAEPAHSTRKSYKTTTRDKPRHSDKLAYDRHHGQPKRQGGGKYNWGNPLEVLNTNELSTRVSDPRDPNYSSDGELDAIAEYNSLRRNLPRRFSVNQQEYVAGVKDYTEFKAGAKKATAEYTVHHLYAEFKSTIDNLHAATIYMQELPSVIIKFSLDQTPAVRTKLDSLLHQLVKDGIITGAQLLAGITKLFDHVDDLSVDVPTARSVLWETVHYLVGYGILSKEDEAQLHEDEELLADRELVSRVKAHYEELIDEYFDNPEVDTVVEQLKDMHTIYFAHQSAPYATALEYEFVKKLLNHALDRNNEDRHNALELLSAVCPAIITHQAVEKAMTQLLERVDDLALDIPNVFTLLSIFLARAVVDDLLPPSFLLRVDSSATDGGQRVAKAAQQLLNEPDAADKLTHIFEAPDEHAKPVAELVESPRSRPVASSSSSSAPPQDQPQIQRSASTPMEEEEIAAYAAATANNGGLTGSRSTVGAF